MHLTDEELTELHSFLQHETLYGDDEIVYGSAGNTLRVIKGKVEDEAKGRKLWWAR